jgi:hypothetical protein
MSNAVWFISYKLVDGASVAEFLLAQEKTNNEIISKQKGFISWKVLVDGDTWVDLITWETMEDAIKGETAGEDSPISQKFFSFIEPSSLNQQCFLVEKSY